MSKYIVNSTQVPNAVIDEIMPQISDAAFKCYVLIVRKTVGWHKESDSISISQFEKLTGKSRNTVIKCCKELEGFGLIVKETENHKSSVYKLHQFNICTSANSELEVVQNLNQGSANSELEVVQNLNTQNKTKQTNQNKTKNTPLPPQGELGDGKKAPSEKPKKSNADVLAVFDFWKSQLGHPVAKLDDKRKKAITCALKWGYAIEDLCQAITGCSLTPHNMGQNDRGQRYDSLQLILRDADQIDRFMGNALNPPRPMSKQETLEAQNAQALADFESWNANQEASV